MTKGRKKSDVRPKGTVGKIATDSQLIRQVKTRRTLPDDLPKIYADGLMVQHKDGMFILSFLQNQYPLIVTPEEIQKVKDIEQRCVSQLLVTPEQMARNLAVLNDNFGKFLDKQIPENRKILEDLLKSKLVTFEEDEQH